MRLLCNCGGDHLDSCGEENTPRACFVVLVPCLNPDGSRGEVWTPYARRCLPTGEDWLTRRLLPVVSAPVGLESAA